MLVEDQAAECGGQGVEGAGYGAGEPGAEAGAEGRGGMEDALEERARPACAWRRDVDVRATGDQGDVGSGFVEQGGGVERAGATAKDGDVAVFELGEGGVIGGVGEEIGGEVAEVFGEVRKGGDAGGEDDVAGEEGFAAFEGDLEAFRCCVDGDDLALLECRDEAAGELASVGDEVFERHGELGGVVLAAGEGAEVFEGEVCRTRREVGGEAVGLELHGGGHLSRPRLHGPSKDAEGDAGLAEMRGEREPIGASADDGNLYNRL